METTSNFRLQDALHFWKPLKTVFEWCQHLKNSVQSALHFEYWSRSWFPYRPTAIDSSESLERFQVRLLLLKCPTRQFVNHAGSLGYFFSWLGWVSASLLKVLDSRWHWSRESINTSKWRRQPSRIEYLSNALSLCCRYRFKQTAISQWSQIKWVLRVLEHA